MSLGNVNIGFIGGGNMARAIIGGLLGAGHDAARINVAEPDAGQRSRLQQLHPGLRFATANRDVAATAGLLVLAVKPQVMAKVLAEIAGAGRPASQLVVSVAAGVTLASIAGGLGGPAAIVRIMPNQPALIGAGMSVLTASAQVSADQRRLALALAEATGRALWISDESLMDAVTAVSGSGPAYFYLLMELMEDGAVTLGLPRDVAATLVRQTALGAARAAAAPGAEPLALRRSVTSPGGTTAAAVAVLEDAGLRAILERALTAARDRGIELGAGRPPSQ